MKIAVGGYLVVLTGMNAVNFSEQPPSTQWAVLTYRGKGFAEVWFKPEGEPLGLSFRIPRESFEYPDLQQRLTPANLLKAVGIAAHEVDWWHHHDVTFAGTSGAHPDLHRPIAPPPPDEPHLDVYVELLAPPASHETPSSAESPPSPTLEPTLDETTAMNADPTPSPDVDAADGPDRAAIPPDRWQDLEVRWRTIQGLEANIDSSCQKMDFLRAEIEGLLKKSLAPDERVHALNADVAQWNKAKNRAHFALPKAKEFIHRATWAKAAAERKKLEEIFKNYVEPRIPFPELDKVPDLLDQFLKSRQVLAALGTTVYQECQSVAAGIQGTLRTLLSNATANANKKKSTAREKGKHF